MMEWMLYSKSKRDKMVKTSWGILILYGVTVLLGFISFLNYGDLMGLFFSLIFLNILFYTVLESKQKNLCKSWIGLIGILFFQVLPVVYIYINRHYFLNSEVYMYFYLLLGVMIFTISLWVYYCIRNQISSDQVK